MLILEKASISMADYGVLVFAFWGGEHLLDCGMLRWTDLLKVGEGESASVHRVLHHQFCVSKQLVVG